MINYAAANAPLQKELDAGRPLHSCDSACESRLLAEGAESALETSLNSCGVHWLLTTVQPGKGVENILETSRHSALCLKDSLYCWQMRLE